MIPTITNTRDIERTHRSEPGKSIIYVDSPLYKATDDFADTHNIFNLNFKSKVWGRVCKAATKANIAALLQLFPAATSIIFSAKAGCKCGCSPGYIMKTDSYLKGKTYWVNIQAEPQEIEQFTKDINTQRNHIDLLKEVLVNSEVSA